MEGLEEGDGEDADREAGPEGRGDRRGRRGPLSLSSRDRPRRRGGRGIAALRRSPVRRPRRPDDRASRRARGAERRRYRGDRGVVEEAQVMSAAMLLQAWGDTLLTTGLLVAAILLIRKPSARAFRDRKSG